MAYKVDLSFKVNSSLQYTVARAWKYSSLERRRLAVIILDFCFSIIYQILIYICEVCGPPTRHDQTRRKGPKKSKHRWICEALTVRLSIFAGHFMRGLSAITVITRTLQAPQNQEAGFISPDINSYEKKNNARFFKGIDFTTWAKSFISFCSAKIFGIITTDLRINICQSVFLNQACSIVRAMNSFY